MPCFLCKNINRGTIHIYGDDAYYMCLEHNEPKLFSYHCRQFDPKSFMDIITNILENYDFFREKLDYIADVANDKGYVLDLGNWKGDPMRYISCEIDDIKQGLEQNRREVEMAFTCMRLWNYAPRSPD